MSNKIRCIVVPEGRDPEVVEIENTLAAFQEVVGGRVESCPFVFEDKPSVYVNEEGKFSGQRPNRAVYAGPEHAAAGYASQLHPGKPVEQGEVMDILFGPILCLGFDPETGGSVSLTDEEIGLVMRRFSGQASQMSGIVEVMSILSES